MLYLCRLVNYYRKKCCVVGKVTLNGKRVVSEKDLNPKDSAALDNSFENKKFYEKEIIDLNFIESKKIQDIVNEKFGNETLF